MAVCQFIVAITGTVAASTNLDAQRAAIAFVCFYIYFFASSWGPVAWVVTGTFPRYKIGFMIARYEYFVLGLLTFRESVPGELFPLKVRAKCLSITTATNWLL
jgi:hypothetical protein